MGREENVTVFKDTENLCKNNKQLAESVRRSIAGQKLVLESESIERRASKNVIKEYLHAFKTMEYAIFCTPRDERNFQVFEKVLRSVRSLDQN